MKNFKGKLEFISFWNPINLKTEDEVIDLRVQIFEIFENLNNKKCQMDYHMNDIKIYVDESSEYKLKYHREIGDKGYVETILMILDKIDGFGMSNIGAYLPDMLQRLNGMQIIVDIDDESISFRHDETEVVPEIKYTDNNNCAISDENAKKICKIGEKDCCIFMSMTGNGFTCQKFNSHMASLLLDRHSKGTMNATRIGNCKIIGRIEK